MKILKIFKRTLCSLKAFNHWLVHYILFDFKTNGIKYDNSGKKLVAIGNGPSAGHFPYEKYKAKGYKFICVNFFALDETRFFNLKPEYYCCIDSAFEKDANKLTGDQKTLVEILNKIDWEMTFVCFKNHELPVSNNNIKFHYINNCEYKSEESREALKLYDKNKATHGYQNVILAVLYYAVMSRFSEVILTGVENDWHRELIVAENNDVYRETTHFYGNERINVTEKGEIEKGKLYKYFYYYYITLYNYYLNASYARVAGVNIYNSCLTSYIDVYKKIDAEAYLNEINNDD